MTLFAMLAASFTFTAIATGVEEGTPVEFVFAGQGTDRDYETLFVIDRPIDEFCRELEKKGLKRGKPENVKQCRLWPTGVKLSLKPDLKEFLKIDYPVGFAAPKSLIYTGGTRTANGQLEALTNMPMSVFSVYSLGQSPIVYDGHYDQGTIYGTHVAAKTLKKGTKVEFTLTWDEKSATRPLSVKIEPGKIKEALEHIRRESSSGDLDVLVDFADELTVGEATVAAQALSLIDSEQVKINGFKPGRLFYRAFLPKIGWRDRKERLVQPFELSLGATNRLVHIDEDWSVDGDDPKLTAVEIKLNDAGKYPKTDTCFIYANQKNRLVEVFKAMAELGSAKIRTWYVFGDK